MQLKAHGDLALQSLNAAGVSTGQLTSNMYPPLARHMSMTPV